MIDHAAKDFLHPVKARVRFALEVSAVLAILGGAYLYAAHTDEQIRQMEAERDAFALCVPLERHEIVSMGRAPDGAIECVIHTGPPGRRETRRFTYGGQS